MKIPSDIKNKFAVLVISCDKYSDLWRPFSQLFQRFWNDCPFNIYLLSNKLPADIPGVSNILSGEDRSWSDNLIYALNQIKEEYVLMYIEDLFLHDYVKQDKLEKVFHWILETDANYVRMNPSIRADKPYNELVGIVSKGTIYRTATVMSVWNKSILLELLTPGESAWDFEIYGTIRSDKYDGFYSTHEDIFPVINTVIKGKWRRRAVKKIQSLEITIDLNKRSTMRTSETILLIIKELRAKILNFFPAKYRRQIKEFILKGNYNYKINA